MSWARLLIRNEVRVVVLIPDRNKAERFRTMWADYVGSDRVFQTTQEERVQMEAVEALFWAGQLGLPNPQDEPLIQRMRYGATVTRIQGPLQGQGKPGNDPGPVARLYPALSNIETETVQTSRLPEPLNPEPYIPPERPIESENPASQSQETQWPPPPSTGQMIPPRTQTPRQESRGGTLSTYPSYESVWSSEPGASLRPETPRDPIPDSEREGIRQRLEEALRKLEIEGMKREMGLDRLPWFQNPRAEGDRPFLAPIPGRPDLKYGARFPIPGGYGNQPLVPQHLTDDRIPVPRAQDIRRQPPIVVPSPEELERIRVRLAQEKARTW